MTAQHCQLGALRAHLPAWRREAEALQRLPHLLLPPREPGLASPTPPPQRGPPNHQPSSQSRTWRCTRPPRAARGAAPAQRARLSGGGGASLPPPPPPLQCFLQEGTGRGLGCLRRTGTSPPCELAWSPAWERVPQGLRHFPLRAGLALSCAVSGGVGGRLLADRAFLFVPEEVGCESADTGTVSSSGETPASGEGEGDVGKWSPPPPAAPAWKGTAVFSLLEPLGLRKRMIIILKMAIVMATDY